MVNRSVLMVAYHYPPVRVSSGVQRTLKFSQYLPEFNWKPIVLTVNPSAYELSSPDQLHEIRSDIVVARAFALDTAKHLAILRRYPEVLALPDRWVTWVIGGVLTGLRLIWRYRPSVLWSTYPIATAHLIGLILHRITGIPWVADFRDSMTEPDYPREPRRWRVFRWIEAKTLRHSSRAIFTTPGAVRMYAERYPEFAEKLAMIPNGYDEENFVRAEARAKSVAQPGGQRALRLVHSGVIYPSERDPRDFFAAVGKLKKQSGLTDSDVQIVLRATGHDDYLRGLLQQYDIEDLVFLKPPIGYEEALVEMLESDGLLLFQGANCNHQIPAKIYEYLRANKPILALTDKGGDTARVLREAEVEFIAPLDNQVEIAETLPRFLDAVRNGTVPRIRPDIIRKFERRSGAQQLAELFEVTV
ncbi:Glyco_trans_4-like_N domain-containing protein [Methylocaldum szegediense]|uniref:Glyco_trans_4-like_N domain-containing protein n=2 Tax=Methylocaldum szegediense TaxID=73780 RepID=A0ABM9I921_9GAMM|nr:Glyco_trans_4-like_N domain-containing protein [Methylocaldum szegediense]